MPTFDYVLMDVFTERPLEGNQLAVFTDATGLTASQMQSIAREMNLSETTFILPHESGEESHRVRIFTTTEELPFAGHPTLGTAAVLLKEHYTGLSQHTDVALDLNVGRIPVVFQDMKPSGHFGEMQQMDPEFGETHDRRAVADVAGISADDLATQWPIQTVNTGMRFAIVPMASTAALRKLNLDWRRASEYLSSTDAKFLYFVATDQRNKGALEARMIFYGGEDPATGSAAGCCISWCVKHGVVPPERQVRIYQGAQVKRPSEIFVRAALDSGKVTNVRVGGFSVEVARGTLKIS